MNIILDAVLAQFFVNFFFPVIFLSCVWIVDDENLFQILYSAYVNHLEVICIDFGRISVEAAFVLEIVLKVICQYSSHFCFRLDYLHCWSIMVI
jgi:hypothetical protein